MIGSIIIPLVYRQHRAIHVDKPQAIRQENIQSARHTTLLVERGLEMYTFRLGFPRQKRTKRCSFFANQKPLYAIPLRHLQNCSSKRNLRPYYKFTAPLVKPSPQEEEIWAKYRDDDLDAPTLKQLLTQVGAHAFVLNPPPAASVLL